MCIGTKGMRERDCGDTCPSLSKVCGGAQTDLWAPILSTSLVTGNWTLDKICISLINIYTWVDQKVLKLIAYLLKYTTELYQTYTEYATTISWFVSVVRMTQYDRRYMTSSFDDVMQQWPGVKKSPKLCFPSEVQSPTFMFHVAVIFSRL